jgi:WD40 repeat protein
MWSEDSSAFYVYSSDGSTTAWYYVSNFDHQWKDILVFNLYGNKSIIQLAIGFVVEVTDIDVGGNTLLLRRNTYSESSAAISQLVSLNMKNLTYDILVEETRGLSAASFGPNGEIYYIDVAGMHIYNSQSETSRLLNTEINSSWIYNVEISPDGRYVAATNGDDNLYIIPVTSP